MAFAKLALAESAMDGGAVQPDAGPAASDADADADATLPDGGTPEQGQPAILGATLNGTNLGELLVVIRAGDVAVRRADLTHAGLRVESGHQEMREHETFVWLASLAPKVAFVFDELALSLTISADPSLFSPSVVDLRAKRPEGIQYASEPSLFVNYAASLYELQSPSDYRWNGFAEAGFSLRGALLYQQWPAHAPRLVAAWSE